MNNKLEDFSLSHDLHSETNNNEVSEGEVNIELKKQEDLRKILDFFKGEYYWTFDPNSKYDNSRIDEILKIKEEFGISEEIIQHQEVMEKAKHIVFKCIHSLNFEAAFKFKDFFSISEEDFKKEIYDALSSKCFDFEHIEGVQKIKDYFNISENDFIECVKKAMIQSVISTDYHWVQKIKEKLNISEEVKIEAVKESVAQRLESVKDFMDDRYEIKKAWDIKLRFELSEKDTADAKKTAMIRILSKGDLNIFLDFKKNLEIRDEFMQSPEVCAAAEKGLLSKLLVGDIRSALKIKDTFNISEAFINSPEVQLALKKEIISPFLSKGLFDKTTDLCQKFNIPKHVFQEDEIKESIEKGIIEFISKSISENASYVNAVIDGISKTQKEFAISKDILESPDVKDIVNNLLVHFLHTKDHYDNDDIEHLLKIKSLFNLPEDMIFEIVHRRLIVLSKRNEGLYPLIQLQKGLGYPKNILEDPEIQNNILEVIRTTIYRISSLDYLKKYVEEVKEHLHISEDRILKIMKSEIMVNISKNEFYLASEIAETFSVSSEFLQSPEVQHLIQEELIKNLKMGDYDARAVMDIFKIKLQDIFIKLPNDQKTRIQMLEDKIPGFIQKMYSSIEIFASVLQLDFEDIQTLLEKPNLLKAIEENSSMGAKLLIQYTQFSESPKENIDTILEIKRKIMEYHPDINPNSHEFRMLVQEQLKPYRRNMDMLTQMKEEGINIYTWLNYSEETLFELGGEEASYAELIKLPSERIQKTLQKYEEEIRTALSKYKKELLDKQVSLIDVSEIQQKISQMQQLAQEAIDAGNEGRIQGIQKGVEGLKKQLENLKQVPAWLKIMSDIDTVSKLFAKVAEINTQIATLDAELTTFAQNPSKESQKKMFENKNKIKELSKEFVSLLETTSTRMDSLLLSIQNSLFQTLGEEISKELISSLNTKLSEDQEHFNSDKATLKNILKMNESDDVKGTLLKIKVWDRNPDIDLYQGNYSDCCVRIDSGYHGSESPISDYITDLGIQIISVYDEKTKKPFAAAWCFIGEDTEGNKAFVVDNIEAMGPYMKYSHDITEKLKTYIEKYAEASGLETISQGPYNNDMVVTNNLEEKYTKLGGYNTQGYYLEAEPDDEYDEYEFDDEEENQDDLLENDNEIIEEELEEQRLIEQYARTQENIVSLEEALNRAQNS